MFEEVMIPVATCWPGGNANAIERLFQQKFITPFDGDLPKAWAIHALLSSLYANRLLAARKGSRSRKMGFQKHPSLELHMMASNRHLRGNNAERSMILISP